MIEPVTFQLSLDQKNLADALAMARLGVDAGVDVLEAGTILILSEGARHALPALRSEFPDCPIVADVKCTDGVGPEFGLMFDLGATKATVMASASDASIRAAVREAGRRPGCAVMVDTMGCSGPDGRDIQGQLAAAHRAQDLGADYVVLHLGYDERSADRSMVDDNVLLRWAEAVARENLSIRVQVVGGLTMEQAKQLPAMGIGEIVISMNLGSRPTGDAGYDQITAFTVDLAQPDNRTQVTHQIRRFLEEVKAERLKFAGASCDAL